MSIAVTLLAMDSLVQKHTVPQFVNTFHIKLEHTLAKLWSTVMMIIIIVVIMIIIHATRTKSKHTSNNRGKWNHVKIIQKIPEQHTEKAQNKETTDNSHTRYSTCKWKSANAYVRNIQHGK